MTLTREGLEAADGESNDNQLPGLNIIVPIGGVGRRFQENGFRYPKPLINIVGKPMLVWVIKKLNLQDNDTVWITIQDTINSEFRIDDTLRHEFPHTDIRLVLLSYLTKGAVETLFITTQHMNEAELRRKTLSVDCDTIYFHDILTRLRTIDISTGACYYFNASNEKPIYSYLREEGGYIQDIQEKKPISDHACTGAYCFPSAETIKQRAAEILDSPLPRLGDIGQEYYTSYLVHQAIKEDGIRFHALEIETAGFQCVGTPAQLESFLWKLAKNPGHMYQKRRFCFDLDMTLVGTAAKPGDYSTCPPIEKNIRLVQQLHAAGHYIIIQTARRMKTHSGNVGAVIADIGAVTLETLSRYKIPYDEIFFGKPYADIYVDDHAVNAHLDTCKELGWQIQVPKLSTASIDCQESASKQGFILARSFNSIQIVGDVVIKSSKADQILGEMNFYANVPGDHAHMFPKVFSMEYIVDSNTYSMAMEKISGTTYSHLIGSQGITRGRLEALLEALYHLHTADTKQEEPASLEGIASVEILKVIAQARWDNSKGDIYENYARKLEERFLKYQTLYERLDEDVEQTFNTLRQYLASYEQEQRGIHVSMIHGDPVFSNVLLVGGVDTKPQVKFIDVRGRLGSRLTSQGDALYDLAKVLQSLHGYDMILLHEDCPTDAASFFPQQARSRLAELQQYFWHFIGENYRQIELRDIAMITASHYFSLIPLHDPKRHSIFYSICKQIIKATDTRA